jgi:hypothetical protein
MNYWKPCVLVVASLAAVACSGIRMRRDLREEHAQEKAAQGAAQQ